MKFRVLLLVWLAASAFAAKPSSIQRDLLPKMIQKLGKIYALEGQLADQTSGVTSASTGNDESGLTVPQVQEATPKKSLKAQMQEALSSVLKVQMQEAASGLTGGAAHSNELQQLNLFPNFGMCLDGMRELIGGIAGVSLVCAPVVGDLGQLIANSNEFQSDVCANEEFVDCKEVALSLVAAGIDTMVSCAEGFGLGGNDDNQEGESIDILEWLSFAAELKTCKSDALQQFDPQQRAAQNDAASSAPLLVLTTITALSAVLAVA